MNMRKKNHYSGGGRSGGNNNNNKRRFTRKPGGGGGGGRFGGAGDDSDFINPRMRKQAQTNRDKYLVMAKDALSSGDRVESEYYLQHADHYLRILNAIDAQFAPRQGNPERPEGQEEGVTAEAEEGEAQELAEEPAAPMPAPRMARHSAPRRVTEPAPAPAQSMEEESDDGAQLASVLPAARTALQ